MKIVKVKLLGIEYEIQCDDSEADKIKIFESRLNNRITNLKSTHHNFQDIHKLLIVSLSLENQINNLLDKEKRLIQELSELNIRNQDSVKDNDYMNQSIKPSLEKISSKIKIIIKELEKDYSE